MIRILQISDTHFGTEITEVMDALVSLCRLQSPDLVILSGDITQRARRNQFAAARAFTDRLDKPLLSIPGNHDLPLFDLFTRLSNPYGNYRRYFGHDLEPEYHSDTLLVLGVNSTRPGRHKNGEITKTQIERVARRLRTASSEQLRIVVQHHPVRAQEKSDTSNLIIGREQAVPAWLDAGMDLLIAGHIHLPYVMPLTSDDLAGGRHGWTVQAGTAVSRRIRDRIPNSVNLILYWPDASQPLCEVERWDYAREDQRFQPGHTTQLPLTRP